MSETDRKLDRLIELTEEQMRGRGSSRGPSIGSSGGFNFFENIKDATIPLKQSLKDFDRALSDSNTSLHTFSKYTYAADNGLAGITRLGTGIPILGKAIEAVGAAFSGLVGAIFKQTDELLQASDQFAKIGAAGSLTTLEIMKMGEKAGLTTKDLGILTNATSKIGTGLIGLGANATAGIRAFADMTEVGADVRKEFQRMGVSQSELIDQQANYVTYLSASGKSMVSQAANAATLKKSSLEYSENLLRLSALTGKSADVLQEEQKQQAMELEEMIAKRQEDDKIAELRKSGAHAEADALAKEQKNRVAFIEDMALKYGKATGVALGKVARTGSYDQTTAGYANLGIDAGKLQSDLKNGVDGTKIANEMGEQLKSGMQSLLKNLGQGAQFNAQELFASMGFTDFKELLGKIGTRIGISDQAQSDAAKKLIEDNKSKTGVAATGVAATDPAQIARNFVKETENSLNLTKQGFIALANVFVQGPALVEKNLKEAAEKLKEFVKNMRPASVVKAVTSPTNIPVANEANITKGEVALGGAAVATAAKVGEAVLGNVPVVGTAFKIIKKVGKTATWAAIIDMIGGDQIADWLKGDTKVEDIKKLPTTIAKQTPIAVNAVTDEVLPGPKQFENIKQGLQGIEKGWENTKNKFMKELTNLIGGLSEISSAPAASSAAPATTTGSPGTSATRSHGTKEETGKEVEPKDVVAQLHAGEKVLPKEEAKIYIKDKAPAATVPVAAPAATTVPVAPAVATTVVVEAKSSTNKTDVGNFSIEDYVAPTTGNFARADRAAPVAAPVAAPAVAPTTGDFARADRAAPVAAAVEAAATARPAISAAETLSKVTLEAVNPVVVDALKKITPSSAPEAAATAFNNSAEMMNKVLFSFNNKCDEMIKKLADANDIATKILYFSR